MRTRVINVDAIVGDKTLSLLGAALRSTMCRFRLRRGEIAAVTGPSGSGKSTLLAVSWTLIRPDSGHVLLPYIGGQYRSRGVQRKAVKEKAMDLLDAVGMVDQSGKRPSQLSGGQRQGVNLARALTNDPQLLVVDGPTGALDQARGAAVMDLIIGVVRERETATLLVTHDRGHLDRMDTVYRMVDGA